MSEKLMTFIEVLKSLRDNPLKKFARKEWADGLCLSIKNDLFQFNYKGSHYDLNHGIVPTGRNIGMDVHISSYDMSASDWYEIKSTKDNGVTNE